MRVRLSVSTAVLMVLALLFAFATSTRIALAKLPVAEFTKDATLGSVSISPSGRYLAQAKLISDGKKTVIAVFDLDNLSLKPTGTAMPDGVTVLSVQWANENRLLISAREITADTDSNQYFGGIPRIIAIDRDGKNLKTLFNNKRLLQYSWDTPGWVHPLPKEPDYVLMDTSDENGRNNLYRVNVNDGSAEMVQKGTKGTYNWLTDLDGVPRVRWDGEWTSGKRQMLVRRGLTDDWDVVSEYNERDTPDIKILGFGDDPTTAIVASRLGGDRFGIYEYNVASKALGRPLFQHPNVDIGSPVGRPIYDPYTTKFVGISYVDDVWFRKYFDPDLARVQANVESGLPGEAIVIATSWSEDRKRFVFYTESPTNPGTYYYYNSERNQATMIGKVYPGLVERELGEMLVIKYTARDGTKIPGYLTLPGGKGDKNLPMIVMPHGGPELRDYVQYDGWAQFLVNRGYAVFQPNFRGSGGYGRAFTEKGHRQWGRLMQDDITDGVKALIKDGTADPKRVCIVGASYGGYAALAGGAFTPDLYKCVVSVAGVSDIPQMIADEKSMHGNGSEVYEYWKKWVGDPVTDLAEMKAASPIFHVPNFTAPVLMIHGTKDNIVLPNQSYRMEKALRGANKQVQLVQIENEGHHYQGPTSKQRLFEEFEKFLSANLGN